MARSLSASPFKYSDYEYSLATHPIDAVHALKPATCILSLFTRMESIALQWITADAPPYLIDNNFSVSGGGQLPLLNLEHVRPWRSSATSIY